MVSAYIVAFAEQVLTKTYYMAEDEEDALEHAEGTEIKWEEGKDITVKVTPQHHNI